MRNQKGFTLIEVMIAAGLLGALALMSSSIMTITMNTQQKIKAASLLATETLLAEGAIYADLRNLDSSFGQITMLDKDHLNFFDDFADVPEAYLKSAASRTVVLNDETDEFVFIQLDATAGPTLVYDPVMAYKVGDAPDSVTTAATLDFISLNQNNIIFDQRPHFWKNGQYLFLDTSTKLRPVTAGAYNFLSAPRSISFLGVVRDQQFLPVAELNQYLNQKDPLTGKTINSADEFFRNLSSSGGAPPFVRIRAIKFVRYYLEKMNGKSTFKLMKSTTSTAGSSRPFMLIDNVETVEFKRPLVNQKIIQFKINKSSLN